MAAEASLKKADDARKEAEKVSQELAYREIEAQQKRLDAEI